MVDRSGSMYGDRIKLTVNALKLFIQSLPPGCMFDIISYGSNYSSMSSPNNGTVYDDQSLESAIKHVSTFDANMCGNEEI